MGRKHIDTRYHLNDHLRRGSAAQTAHVKNIRRGRREDSTATFEQSAISADHIAERLFPRAGLAAANRRIAENVDRHRSADASESDESNFDHIVAHLRKISPGKRLNNRLSAIALSSYPRHRTSV